jgi:hypothetical protein
MRVGLLEEEEMHVCLMGESDLHVVHISDVRSLYL